MFHTTKVTSHAKLNSYECGNHKTVHRIIFTVILIASALFQYWRFARSRFVKVKPILTWRAITFCRITLALFIEFLCGFLLEGTSKFAELCTCTGLCRGRCPISTYNDGGSSCLLSEPPGKFHDRSNFTPQADCLQILSHSLFIIYRAKFMCFIHRRADGDLR